MEVSMLRRLAVLSMVPLVFSLAGCSTSSDLPTVPPPPPAGSIKPTQAEVKELPEGVMEKLRQKKEQDAAKEAEAAKTSKGPGKTQ
jgi:hypothetical protein